MKPSHQSYQSKLAHMLGPDRGRVQHVTLFEAEETGLEGRHMSARIGAHSPTGRDTTDPGKGMYRASSEIPVVKRTFSRESSNQERLATGPNRPTRSPVASSTKHLTDTMRSEYYGHFPDDVSDHMLELTKQQSTSAAFGGIWAGVEGEDDEESEPSPESPSCHKGLTKLKSMRKVHASSPKRMQTLGKRTGTQPMARGTDQSVDLQIDDEPQRTGLQVVCPVCGGNGKDLTSQQHACWRCEGAGMVTDAGDDESPEAYEVVIKRPPGEKLGVTWHNHTVIHSVQPGSPADRQGLANFLGFRAIQVNGAPVKTLGCIQRRVQGSKEISMLLIKDTGRQSTVGTMSDSVRSQ